MPPIEPVRVSFSLLSLQVEFSSVGIGRLLLHARPCRILELSFFTLFNLNSHCSVHIEVVRDSSVPKTMLQAW